MSKVKVLFVCLGNICRSPLAEGVFRHKVEERGLEDSFEIDSCGTVDCIVKSKKWDNMFPGHVGKRG